MVINGSCSTNMYARQLSFNFSSMVWGGGHGPVAPPLDPPLTGGKVAMTDRQRPALWPSSGPLTMPQCSTSASRHVADAHNDTPVYRSVAERAEISLRSLQS